MLKTITDPQLSNVLLLRFARFCVNVMRRHVPAAVAQHPLNDHRVSPLLCKPSCQPVTQVVKTETDYGFTVIAKSALLLPQYSGSNSSRADVVFDNHAP